ncbi:MAG: hypothetical protein EA362_02735 [Saprospirales bacterium]|nr:MAG: hypothetical protein EA362_02735 [Saprospirales bacterium]
MMNLIISLILLLLTVWLVLFQDKFQLPTRLVRGMFPEEKRSLREFIKEGIILIIGLGYFFTSVQALSEIIEPTIVSNTFFSCAFFIIIMFAVINLHPYGRKISVHKKITIPALVILVLFLLDFFLQKIYPGEYYLFILAGGVIMVIELFKWVLSIFKVQK